MSGKALPCPVETTLRLMSNRWVILILRDLLTGTKRFGELKKSLPGISQKVLTSSLRAMEADGLLTRTAYLEIPPRVEYALTALGESLRPVLYAMYAWGMHLKETQGDEITEELLAMGEVLRKKRRVKPAGKQDAPAKPQKTAAKAAGAKSSPARKQADPAGAK